jgi:hypothetical protein
VHQRDVNLGGRAREVAGAVGIDRVRLALVLLSAVDVGPGGAVDHPIQRVWLRAQAPQQLPDRTGIGDVDLGQVDPDELMPGARARAQDVVAEHSLRAGDEQAHHQTVRPGRPGVGDMSWRAIVTGSRCRSCRPP